MDAFVAGGFLKGMAEYEFPVVLGRDYAGVVEQVGSEVTRYAEGEEVYGFVPAANPTVHDGSWAELIAVPQNRMVARRPAGVDARQAGAAPVAALTAVAAGDAMGLGQGATVLVVGASGGVGSFAVQLAARAGAAVVAPALPEDGDYLRGLGVAEVVDRDGDVVAAVRGRHPGGVDALLDLVSQAPDALNC
jgi:NADPH:quinone reductase-like Zn-dependent oxidoreductase